MNMNKKVTVRVTDECIALAPGEQHNNPQTCMIYRACKLAGINVYAVTETICVFDSAGNKRRVKIPDSIQLKMMMWGEYEISPYEFDINFDGETPVSVSEPRPLSLVNTLPSRIVSSPVPQLAMTRSEFNRRVALLAQRMLDKSGISVIEDEQPFFIFNQFDVEVRS